MKVSIRRFEKKDIPNKIKWINNPQNNVYLHYELPLEKEKTEKWFENNKNRDDRYDAVIEVDETPVGLIGLLSIDSSHKCAEYYVTLGEREYLGKGIAARATKLLLEHAFTELKLNRIYLYTEFENINAIRMYERIGFKRKGIKKNDLFSRGRFVDRYTYEITSKDYYHLYDTPIYCLDEINGNKLYIKREDVIPFSFGGNKARKAELFFDQIDQGNYDCVVTYGTSSSNHCRVIANMAASRNMLCVIVSPEEALKETYNSEMMKLFGAEIVICKVNQVHDTIEDKLAELREKGYHPYFIAGGGHGNIGTQAYVECYTEICRFEREHHVHFDYVFHASGTGTTQAGLICGQLIHCDTRKIVGISIARANPRGRQIVLDSVEEFLTASGYEIPCEVIDNATIFIDSYIVDGYGQWSKDISEMIRCVLIQYGVPLDHTYTGKAFAGMLDYLKQEKVVNSNVLFIHTGGTPLFFDGVSRMSK